MSPNPSAIPAIVILGSSALKLAEKIRAALGEAEIHGLAARGGDTDASFTEAMPHIAETTVNSATPTRKARLRPMVSPRRPPSSISPPKVST